MQRQKHVAVLRFLHLFLVELAKFLARHEGRVNNLGTPVKEESTLQKLHLELDENSMLT